MSGIGTTGIILIVLVALLLFGPSKLPELGRAFGRTLREFKNGAKDIMSDDEADERKEVHASERREINGAQTQQHDAGHFESGRKDAYTGTGPEQQTHKDKRLPD